MERCSLTPPLETQKLILQPGSEVSTAPTLIRRCMKSVAAEDFSDPSKHTEIEEEDTCPWHCYYHEYSVSLDSSGNLKITES